MSVDVVGVRRQFEGLHDRHPALWPLLPRLLLLLACLALLITAGWFFYWSGLLSELESSQSREVQLRREFQEKVTTVVNLNDLRRQKAEVERYVGALEKQLPSRAEMNALLSDINQAGVGRGAQLQLFKPGVVQVQDSYAALPIAVKVVGSYHDLGSFSSDLANLPRIVTLNNLSISRQGSGDLLQLDAIAKTFRYLDNDEIGAQRQAAALKKQAVK